MTTEENERAKEGFRLLKEMFYSWIAVLVFCVIMAAIMKSLFPVFMSIVAIGWPEWVIAHCSRFSSWFIVLFTIRLAMMIFRPTKRIPTHGENKA
jgi:uncharacterized membrane protein